MIRRPFPALLLLPLVLSLPFLAACRVEEARATEQASPDRQEDPGGETDDGNGVSPSSEAAAPAAQAAGAMRSDPHSGVMMEMSHEAMVGAAGEPMGAAMAEPMSAHMRMTAPRPPSAADRERAAEILDTLRDATAKYRDWHRAVADGYKPFLPNLPQKQVHFTNWRYGLAAAFRFDPARPTSLLYLKTAAGYDLVGAMYTAPQRWPEARLDERVPLSVARWHQHVDLCLPRLGQGKTADWSRFGVAGSIATAADCLAAGGRFYPAVFGWMVHVYPWATSPDRIWAH